MKHPPYPLHKGDSLLFVILKGAKRSEDELLRACPKNLNASALPLLSGELLADCHSERSEESESASVCLRDPSLTLRMTKSGGSTQTTKGERSENLRSSAPSVSSACYWRAFTPPLEGGTGDVSLALFTDVYVGVAMQS